MAKVELRLRTFIPWKNVFFTSDGLGNEIYFDGDDRGPVWSTLDYRTSQSFVLDTAKADYGVTYANKVGVTTVYHYYNGNLTSSQSTTQGTGGLGISDVVRSDDNLYITVTCKVADPLVDAAPPIDYKFTIKVTRKGSVRITGNFDGFPSYELWRKIDSGSPQLVWDFKPKSQANIAYLYGEMEEYVDKGLSA